MIDLDKKRKQWENAGKVIGFAALGFFCYTIILKAILGVIGVTILAAIGLLVINVGIPAFSAWIANLRIAAIKAAIAADPIASAENAHWERVEAANERLRGIQEFQAELQSYEDQVEELIKQWPEERPQYEAD